MWRKIFLVGLVCLSGVLGQAQDLVIYGLIRESSGRELLAGSTVTIADSSLVPLDRWVTGDSGDYEFYLQMDQVYTMRCSSPGYLPKHVVIDTRNVDASEEEREGGWGMNIDMSLFRSFQGVDTALLKVPFGYAAWNSADTSFAWDMPHTEKVRAQWAAILPAKDAEVSEAFLPLPEPVDPPPSWARFAVAIGLILLGRWGFELLFARSSGSIATQQRLLLAMLAGAGLFGFLGWQYWSGTGWEHVLAFGAAVASIGLVVAVVRHCGPVLDHRLSEGVPMAPEERAGGQKILKWMSWSGYILAIVCGFVLFAAMERTLNGEEHLLFNLAWAAGLIIVLLVLLNRPAKRWFVHPADRVRFWLILGAVLLVLVPTGIHLTDRQLAGQASVQRLAEIVGLNEVSRRRGRTTFHAVVLVDGEEKDIVMENDQWDELGYSDALSLTIQRGPTGIDHITGWDPILRGE